MHGRCERLAGAGLEAEPPVAPPPSDVDDVVQDRPTDAAPEVTGSRPHRLDLTVALVELLHRTTARELVAVPGSPHGHGWSRSSSIGKKWHAPSGEFERISAACNSSSFSTTGDDRSSSRMTSPYASVGRTATGRSSGTTTPRERGAGSRSPSREDHALASSSAISFFGAVRRYEASRSSTTSAQSVVSSRSRPIQPYGPR